MKCFIATLLLFIFSSYSLADSEAMPWAKITASSYGNHYFKMIPSKVRYEDNKQIIESEAYGVAFQLDMDGTEKEIWRVKEWYSFENYLSDDGQYLVRMGNWHSGCGTSEDDLAIAFYKNGIEIKRYSTADLINNNKSIACTVSHYFWLSKDDSYPKIQYRDNFHLKTIENEILIFDITNGELKT